MALHSAGKGKLLAVIGDEVSVNDWWQPDDFSYSTFFLLNEKYWSAS